MKILKGFGYSYNMSVLNGLEENRMYFINDGDVENLLNSGTKDDVKGKEITIVETSFKDVATLENDGNILAVFGRQTFVRSGGAFTTTVENDKNVLHFIPEGEKMSIIFLDKDKFKDQMFKSFVIEHEKAHIMRQDKNLGVFAKIEPEIAADEIAFREVGIIDKDGNADIKWICDIYTNLFNMAVSANVEYFKLYKKEMLDYIDNGFVKKTLNKEFDVESDIRFDMQKTILKRANGLEFEGSKKIKFVFDENGNITTVPDNKALKTGLKIAGVVAAIGAAGTGTFIAFNKKK